MLTTATGILRADSLAVACPHGVPLPSVSLSVACSTRQILRLNPGIDFSPPRPRSFPPCAADVWPLCPATPARPISRRPASRATNINPVKIGRLCFGVQSWWIGWSRADMTKETWYCRSAGLHSTTTTNKQTNNTIIIQLRRLNLPTKSNNLRYSNYVEQDY